MDTWFSKYILEYAYLLNKDGLPHIDSPSGDLRIPTTEFNQQTKKLNWISRIRIGAWNRNWRNVVKIANTRCNLKRKKNVINTFEIPLDDFDELLTMLTQSEEKEKNCNTLKN